MAGVQTQDELSLPESGQPDPLLMTHPNDFEDVVQPALRLRCV